MTERELQTHDERVNEKRSTAFVASFCHYVATHLPLFKNLFLERTPKRLSHFPSNHRIHPLVCYIDIGDKCAYVDCYASMASLKDKTSYIGSCYQRFLPLIKNEVTWGVSSYSLLCHITYHYLDDESSC